ncbi:MAG: DUF5302 domain-containing protein [Rhodococcus sp.]|nr:DUF5302 domain-containing protein [Rhodococcus sp. (in: high G+C Gram-positive bacteria)]
MTDSIEDTKQKFREALDRKNHHDSHAVDHKDAESKAHDAHGPADHKRDFRRKTG